MRRRLLTKAEARAYREGGFRLEGPPRTEEEAAHDHLAAARQLLKLWGADAAAVRATLAAPSARALRRWQMGEAPIPSATQERVAIVLALYRRCFVVDNGVSVDPLPSLRRPGQPALAPRDLLASGRLADLLALWRQMTIDEEAAQRPARSPAAPRPRPQKKGRRP